MSPDSLPTRFDILPATMNTLLICHFEQSVHFLRCRHHLRCPIQLVTDNYDSPSSCGSSSMGVWSPYTSNFQPFSSQGTQKLITKILQYSKKSVKFFADLAKKIGNIFIHVHQMVIVVLAAVIFLKFANLRENKSVLLTQ